MIPGGRAYNSNHTEDPSARDVPRALLAPGRRVERHRRLSSGGGAPEKKHVTRNSSLTRYTICNADMNVLSARPGRLDGELTYLMRDPGPEVVS